MGSRRESFAAKRAFSSGSPNVPHSSTRHARATRFVAPPECRADAGDGDRRSLTEFLTAFLTDTGCATNVSPFSGLR